MKFKFLYLAITVFSIFLVVILSACNQQTVEDPANPKVNTEDNLSADIEGIIIVQKRVDYEDKYEDFKEVTDNEQVLSIKEILDDTDWENAEVSMVRPPEYKFHFEYTDKDIESNTVQYSVWISPNKDKLEVVIVGKGKYTQLTKEDSAILFEDITGENLSDLK